MNLQTIYEHTFDVTEPPKVILDLGANMGQFARAALAAFPDAQVVSYEPTPGLLVPTGERWLVRELAIVPEDHTDDTIPFHIDHTDSWNSSWVFEFPDMVSVPAVHLSRALAAWSPDFVKMDIEGAEIHVIRSMTPDQLRRARQYSVEFHDFIDHHYGAVLGVIAHMVNAGFALAHVHPDKTVHGSHFVDTLFIRRH